jgi:hypothetical protein
VGALTQIRFKKALYCLQFAREHLDEALHQAIEEDNKLSRRLAEYESVGLGFDKLAAEYAEILEQIEEKQWALNEIHKGSESKEALFDDWSQDIQ